MFQHLEYFAFGETFVEEHSNTQRTPYKFNGKELDEETGLYYFPMRYYDAQASIWLTVDPVLKYHESPYAWNTNNPLMYSDPTGADSTQRANALAKAEQFVSKNSGNTYKMGAKGAPGEKVDCSGLVSQCVVAGDESDPNKGTKNGVTNISNNTKAITESEVEPGNIVILNGSSHTGLITEVERDESGNIINLNMIDSGGDPKKGVSGPRITKLIDGGVKKYWGKKIDGYRKWDTVPDQLPTIQLDELIIYGEGGGGLKPRMPELYISKPIIPNLLIQKQ